jgi:hypothetical protein
MTDPSMNAAFMVLESVAQVLRDRVVNQARYVYPVKEFSDTNDAMYEFADIYMTDEQTLPYLKGKDILSNGNIIGLAAEIGVSNIFSDDGWVDTVAEYIIKHKADCADLWEYINNNC